MNTEDRNGEQRKRTDRDAGCDKENMKWNMEQRNT